MTEEHAVAGAEPPAYSLRPADDTRYRRPCQVCTPGNELACSACMGAGWQFLDFDSAFAAGAARVVAAVEALHYPCTEEADDDEMWCGYFDCNRADWPCDTVRAARGAAG